MKRIKKIAVLALSGGMDSSCLLIHLLANQYDVVFCISFDYGQKHKVEIQKAKELIDFLYQQGVAGYAEECKVYHQVVDLTSVMSTFNSALTQSDINVPEGHYEEANMKSTVVPNRNAIFSSIIYGLALSKSQTFECDVDVSLGIHSGDHAIYPDCTPEFRDAIEDAFRIGNYGSDKISYYVPFLHGNKTSILEETLENCQDLKIDFDEVLKRTITSYNPDNLGRSSGKSGSDIERIEAFINIGRKDPIEYQKPWEEIVEEAKQILQAHK